MSRRGLFVTNPTKQQKLYQVKGTATVSVWMDIHAESRAEALEKANAGEYEESPDFDSDGDISWETVTERTVQP